MSGQVRRHAILARPPLCPELELYLITEACPLWTAAEADLERLGLPPPFWAFAWPGGQALARHVLDNPGLVAGRRVLDFGAGSGIEGIAAALRGARSVVASDLDPVALEAMALNAARNGVSLELTGEDLIGTLGDWDLVLAGDVFYEPDLAERALGWMRALAGRGTRVLLGDPGRGYLPASSTREVASYLAPCDVDVGGRLLRPTGVLEVLPEPAGGSPVDSGARPVMN